MLSEVEASPRHGWLYVILNEVKNLEVSVAVDGSASLEILRCTQDDIKSERLPRSLCSLAMTMDSISLVMTMYSVWPARRYFALLSMTYCVRLPRLVPSLAMTQ